MLIEKNLAIANTSCVGCAHNTLGYVEGIYRPNYPVTLKCRLGVIQGHCKRNHWIAHTRLSSRRATWRWLLSWPWNV